MLANYGVLRGAIINSLPFNSSNDHYQIEVQADDIYRIAVDVYSALAGTNMNYSSDGNTKLAADRLVLYYKDENYSHPVTQEFLNVKTGFTPKAAMSSSICLDYVHFSPPLFPLDAMKLVKPQSDNAPGEDLNDDIGPWVQKASNNPDAEVFAFGSGWNDNAPGSRPDKHKYFDPNPALGIHDIHMNQGDTGREAKNNGSHQDGALFIHFKSANQWVAMFFRFQNQSTTTDDNGNPVAKS